MTDSRRQRRVWYVVGGVAIAAFAALGASSFKANLTPYVSFAEAARGAGKVQIAGQLVKGSSSYETVAERLAFQLVDAGGTAMAVTYAGIKPGNFEEALEIVAVGRYVDGTFRAEQLLVKCPSKYQGLDEAPGGAAASDA